MGLIDIKNQVVIDADIQKWIVSAVIPSKPIIKEEEVETQNENK